MKKTFKDKAIFNSGERTAITIRSGVLLYDASELGMNPESGTQSVYRSPATIFNASQRMAGIPVTNEHVDIDMPPPINGGKVISSEAIDIVDEENDATIAIKNKLDISDNMQRIIESKKELSLGYQAELVPHDIYDFEQINIMPHHLAIVPNGRCGSMCSFVDHKPLIENPKEVEMKIKFKDAKGKVTAKSIIAALNAFTDNKANFTDAKGNVNMQQIIDVITALPEAIKTVPVDQVAKVMPHLEALIVASRQVATEEEAVEETMAGQEEDAGVTNPDGSETTDEESEEVSDIEVEDADEESKEVEVEDAETEKEEDEKEDKKDFSDSMAFKDAVTAKAKIFTDKAISTIEKARNFLGDDYVFEGKETSKIMRDALKTATTDTFADAELDIAFKMLKDAGSYKEFGDSKEANKWDELGEKSF